RDRRRWKPSVRTRGVGESPRGIPCTTSRSGATPGRLLEEDDGMRKKKAQCEVIVRHDDQGRAIRCGRRGRLKLIEGWLVCETCRGEPAQLGRQERATRAAILTANKEHQLGLRARDVRALMRGTAAGGQA